jgi:hypothetical protein
VARRTLANGKQVGGIRGKFAAFPHEFANTPEFAALSGRAVKLLLELELQYNRHNNGDLCASYSRMAKRGFKSADQLRKALNELINGGWIMLTRQGGRHTPSLYAITYWHIDPCGGKLDVPAGPPPHLWKRDQAQWRETRTSKPTSARGFKGKPLDRDTVQVRPRHGPILDRDTVQAS